MNAHLFHAWEANDSSLLNVLMPDGFPIAPQWISPILTAGLTATKCLSASESAENASVRLLRWNVVSLPGIGPMRIFSCHVMGLASPCLPAMHEQATAIFQAPPLASSAVQKCQPKTVMSSVHYDDNHGYQAMPCSIYPH